MIFQLIDTFLRNGANYMVDVIESVLFLAVVGGICFVAWSYIVWFCKLSTAFIKRWQRTIQHVLLALGVTGSLVLMCTIFMQKVATEAREQAIATTQRDDKQRQAGVAAANANDARERAIAAARRDNSNSKPR
jgi:type VI protein secretion system component VasK